MSLEMKISEVQPTSIDPQVLTSPTCNNDDRAANRKKHRRRQEHQQGRNSQRHVIASRQNDFSATSTTSLSTTRANSSQHLVSDADQQSTLGCCFGESTNRRTMTSRLVNKKGESQVYKRNVEQLRRRYITDMFTTLVEMKWTYSLLLFFITMTSMWILFAIIWWILAIVHDDPLHRNDAAWTTCVYDVYDFKSSLLFSIETQHTIGYGHRYIETVCPAAYVVLMIQCSVSLLIHTILTGIIFVKLSQPRKRSRTIIFSKQAVIFQQRNRYRLAFRVADIRQPQLINCSMQVFMITDQHHPKLADEPFNLSYHRLQLDNGVSISGYKFRTADDVDNSNNNNDDVDGDQQQYVLLAWPLTVFHTINYRSPLWNLSANMLLSKQTSFEILVILEGTVQTTSSITQVRTSYLPDEILWGYRLQPMAACPTSNGHYVIDYKHFNDVIPVSMPQCSAMELQQHALTSSSTDDDNENTQTTTTSNKYR